MCASLNSALTATLESVCVSLSVLKKEVQLEERIKNCEVIHKERLLNRQYISACY